MITEADLQAEYDAAYRKAWPDVLPPDDDPRRMSCRDMIVHDVNSGRISEELGREKARADAVTSVRNVAPIVARRERVALPSWFGRWAYPPASEAEVTARDKVEAARDALTDACDALAARFTTPLGTPDVDWLEMIVDAASSKKLMSGAPYDHKGGPMAAGLTLADMDDRYQLEAAANRAKSGGPVFVERCRKALEPIHALQADLRAARAALAAVVEGGEAA